MSSLFLRSSPPVARLPAISGLIPGPAGQSGLCGIPANICWNRNSHHFRSVRRIVVSFGYLSLIFHDMQVEREGVEAKRQQNALSPHPDRSQHEFSEPVEVRRSRELYVEVGTICVWPKRSSSWNPELKSRSG